MEQIKVNKYQTPIEDLKLESLPNEVQTQFWEFFYNVPFIQSLTNIDRPRACDLPRDSMNRIIVDITKPHILENMDYFRPSAIHYQKTGKYTDLRPNSNPNSEYGKWFTEEIRRCREGYVREEDGEWIPGDLYWFWNYCPMSVVKKTDKRKKKGMRVVDFPSVWEGHYLKSHYLYQAREAGKHAVELASRSKGKSYYGAGMLSKRFYLGESAEVNKKVTCYATAAEKKYLVAGDQTLDKFQFDIDFVADNTELPHKRLINTIQNMQWTLGYIDLDSGTRKGKLNSVIGVTAKDDESKLRGTRGVLYIIEEGGCHLKGTEVRMYDGSTKTVEDVIVGDELMGNDGTSRKVLQLYSGFDKMYQITLSNGDYQIVNSKHPVYYKTFDSNTKKYIEHLSTAPELMELDTIETCYISKYDYKNKTEETNYSFTIKEWGDGEYYGFTLDKNQLFLLKDNTIVHNTFPRLLDLWGNLLPSTEEGSDTFGMLYTYGTAGDVQSDFYAMSEMMYHPDGYHVYATENVYDIYGKGGKQFSFFFPGYINRANCYDENGNSDVTKAILEILLDRYQMRHHSTDINAIIKRTAEIPIVPQEAILRTRGNMFPVAAINERIAYLQANEQEMNEIYVGALVQNSNGEVTFTPTEDTPIRKFPLKDSKAKGALEIYKHPEKDSSGKIPNDRYIASEDPVDYDSSDNVSLASMFVLDLFTDTIVAEYTGRQEFADDNYEILRKLCLYYNAKCLYENNLRGTYAYFSKMNCLYLLAETPEFLRDRDIVKVSSYGNTSRGVTATKAVNDYANTLIRNWLISPRTKIETDSEGNPVETTVMNVSTLKNIALLQELSLYNPEINVDRVRSLGLLMIYREHFMVLYGGDPSVGMTDDDDNDFANDEFFRKNFY